MSTTETDPVTGTDAAGRADDVTAAASALRALAAEDGGEVLAGQLSRLVTLIATEAARTKRFRTDLLEALVPAPVDGVAGGPEGAHTRSALQKLTIAKLRTLIDREGMDPDRTIRSRTTKGELIDLILAFEASRGEAAGKTTGNAETAGTPNTAERTDGHRAELTPTETGSASARQPAAQEAEPDTTQAQPDDTASEPVAAPQPVPENAPAATDDRPPANPPKRRRRPAPLDPYAVVNSDGADGLRHQLQRLNIEELKDIIAEYGMNYDGRAMSWHDHNRFVERIVEKADFGATQGKAFRR